MKMKWLNLFGFLLVFRCFKAMEVGFSEQDYAVSEDRGSLEIVLTVIGLREQDVGVTLEVTPMTIDDYLNMRGTLPRGVSVETDPAEPDLDYNSTSHYVEVQQGQKEISLYIDIVDDTISELEEIFVLHLRDVTEAPGKDTEVQLGRDVSTVVITQPVWKRASIRLSPHRVTITEGEAEMDQLFIEVDRPIELAVTVFLSVQYNRYTPREDLEVATNVTIPANSIDRVLIPIHATDDLIAEEEECIAVILSHLMQPLYTINRTSNGGYSTICIQDNDVPKLGIRSRGNESVEVEEGGGLIEMMEGETRELCVVLLEPEACTMYISATVSPSPNTASGIVPFEEEIFFTGLHCFEVTATGNSFINPPVAVQLDIHTQIFYDDKLQPGGEHVLIEPGLLIIGDDDGVPVSPEQVEFEFVDTEVRISWVARPSELQPIDKFVVLVQAMPTRSVTRSRRQVQVPLLAAGELWEQETNETNLNLRFMDSSISYEISVCAENSLGRMCSSPKRVTGEQLSRPKPEPKEAGLEGKSPSSSSSSTVLSLPILIAIAAAIPVILLVLCVIVLLVVCKCRRSSREYFPSRQGTPEEKIVMGTVAFVEPKYTKTSDSYTSSISLEWTGSSEPYSKPLTSTPSKPPTTTFGTPV